MKSPTGVDADGFKRSDGESILGHKNWWKIIPLVSVDVYQVGSNFLLPVSLVRPVPDDPFGEYTVVENEIWGIKMAYVTGIIRDRKNVTIGYVTDAYGQITRAQGVQYAALGKLDNVIVVGKRGNAYLRAKPNMTIEDNLG